MLNRRGAPSNARLVARWSRASPSLRVIGEVATIETTRAAAAQKLEAMRQHAARNVSVHLGMPDFRPAAARSTVNA